ncbi:MAG: methyl-accepting chemotaxis protein [Pseudomonadota bacterium]
MLNRISVSALLKSVIGSLGAVVVIMLALDAWSAWKQYQTAIRSAAVIDVSRNLFTALHNLRVDRSTTFRDLTGQRQLTELSKQTQEVRAAELAALKTAIPALAVLNFPNKESLYPAMSASLNTLTALHAESARAVTQPRESRRPELAKEFSDEATKLLSLLDKTSEQLTAMVKLDDAMIDQLLAIKQLAWIARNSAGDAQVMVSNGLAGQKLPADAMLIYTANLGKTDAVWAALEDTASGLKLPPQFHDAVRKAKAEFFDPSYAALRLKVFKAVLAGENTGIKPEEWTPGSVAKLASLLGVAEVSLDIAKDHASAKASLSLFRFGLSLALLVLALAVVGVMMTVVSRRVTHPLRNIQGAMLKLADGDFSVVLPGLDRKDEIGDVANAVERFKVLAMERAKAEADEALKRQAAEAELQVKAAEERARAADEQARAMRALGEGLKRLANGDLMTRLDEGFTEDYRAIKDDFNATLDRLQSTIAAIAQANDEVSNAAAEIAAATTDLSQRTEEQAASLEQTSASMEQISATVKQNASNAQQANALTQDTAQIADQGGQVVAEAVSAMARIEESSRRISDIISVIDEIARQTNLLALNAAVEAARAGEAGRGFAVVASEVRSLAQRSSQAAKDIKDLIVNSTVQVQEGVDLVNRAGTSLGEIVESIKKVAGIMSDIANASAEQATGLEQVSKALVQMDEVTQQNSALVEQNAATAKTLEDQQNAMRERMSFFSFGQTVEAPKVVTPVVTRKTASAAKPVPMAKPELKPAARRAAAAPRVHGANALKDDQGWEEF